MSKNNEKAVKLLKIQINSKQYQIDIFEGKFDGEKPREIIVRVCKRELSKLEEILDLLESDSKARREKIIKKPCL